MANVNSYRLNEFTSTTRWWTHLWGGGHTIETDPTRRGWRAFPAGKADAVLVGRFGVPGCFSAVPLSEGRLDVAFYDEAPEEVARLWKVGEHPDCDYLEVQDCPGWALVAIQKLAEVGLD